MKWMLTAICMSLVSGHCRAQSSDPYMDASTIRVADLPQNPPKFSDYSVPVFVGRPVAPDIGSHPRSRLFRSKIREGARRGSNFAGHYAIVGWGCGLGCISLAIVDTQTGQVFHPGRLNAIDNINVDPALDGEEDSLIKYRSDSRLLVVIGGINEDPMLRGISYFVWEHDKLRRVRFVHKPYEVE